MEPESNDPTKEPGDAETFSLQFAAETEEMNRCLDLLTDLAERSDCAPPPPENFRPGKFRPR
ncbi:hypothetical protein [Actinomadura sp. 9N215]|uniref:hypothetical protein n=1 Tax=Actinomadura sp. 9N215 TaxID=3375150 RepID=UPI0037B0BC67